MVRCPLRNVGKKTADSRHQPWLHTSPHSFARAAFARERHHVETAKYLEEYADFLESHVDQWTVTTEGTLVQGISRHFIRIHPMNPNDVRADEGANFGQLSLKNIPVGERSDFPAKDIVDAGFLELVRYGVRKPTEPLIEDSLKVIDEILKVDTPFGPCWRRYNHDGYGQKSDGGPFQGFGYGHAWPVLTGERGHYELAASRDPKPYIKAMEKFATSAGLIPEQVWALPGLPQAHMESGRATGGATPLVWAHAEYMQLVRSAADGKVFGNIEQVARHFSKKRICAPIEIWKFNRQVAVLPGGGILRIQADSPFRLHWTSDEWQQSHDTDSTSVGTGQQYVDITAASGNKRPIRFTFYWTVGARWDGRDFSVEIV